MKGLTHFMSGVALASFIPAAMKLGNNQIASSYIMALGGFFGIMPDTLDFKVGQFFEKPNYEVEMDPNKPDPQDMAEQIARAMDECDETGRYIKVQLYPMRVGVDLWRQYVVKFDPDTNEVVIVINEIVTTSQVPYLGTEPETNRIGRAKVKGKMLETHGRPSVVDIMSGPMFGFKKVKERVEVEFLPWHRTWSHSYVLGFFLACIAGLIASLIAGWNIGWLYGLVGFLGYSIHITEDLTGHMGGSLLWPFVKSRTNGLCLFKASNPHANFQVDYVAAALILFNMNRFSPTPFFTLSGWQYFLFVLVIPLSIYYTLNKMAGEIGGVKKKKPGEISANRALADQQAGLNEEMLDDEEEAQIGAMM